MTRRNRIKFMEVPSSERIRTSIQKPTVSKYQPIIDMLAEGKTVRINTTKYGVILYIRTKIKGAFTVASIKKQGYYVIWSKEEKVEVV